MQERRDTEQEGCSTGGMQNRRDVEQEGCRKGGMQSRRDAGQEGFRTGWMQIKRMQAVLQIRILICRIHIISLDLDPYQKLGWIRNLDLDPYQIIQIQQTPLNIENKFFLS